MMTDRNPSETTMRTSCSSFVTTGSSDRSVFRGHHQQQQQYGTIDTISSSATHSTVTTTVMGSPSSYLSLSSPTRPMLRKSLLSRSATEGNSPPRGLLQHTVRSSLPDPQGVVSSTRQQDNTDTKKSQSFRLRKRNRAWSHQDFDCLLDIGHGAWTATMDPLLLLGQQQQRRVRQNCGGHQHNDRTKNHAYAQLDFERFIFDTRRDLPPGHDIMSRVVDPDRPDDHSDSNEDAIHPLLRRHPPTVSHDDDDGDDDDSLVDVEDSFAPDMHDSTLSATMASF